MAEVTMTTGLLDRFPALRRLGRIERHIPVIQQLSATECGPTCLAMVLGYHGKTMSREELRDVLTTGRDGSSARDLLNAARFLGLRGRGVKVELSGLKHLPCASILHWEFNHFVVFEALSADGVDIVDPNHGRRHVSMEEMNRAFTGVALVLEPSEQFQPTASREKTRQSNVATTLRVSGSWGRIFTMSFFLQALGMVLPMLMGLVVDRVVPRADRHMLLVVMVGLGAVVLFQLLASLIRAHLLLEMRTLVDARMTFDFLEHLIGLPYGFFQRRSTGDLLMRLNSNVLIRQTLTSGVLSSVLDGFLMLAYFVLLFVASVPTGLLVLAFGILQVLIFLATSRARRNANAFSVAHQARAQSYQVEMFAGIETLKATGAEGRAQEHWSNLFVDVLNATIDEGRLNALVEALGSTLRMAAPLATGRFRR